MAAAEHQFVAWVRTGIGALLDGGARRITLELDGAAPVARTVTPYGPGDVTGFAEGTIVRTVPRDGAVDFEPNLFPAVELAHPALPWVVSPPAERPLPWIVLVVAEVGPGVTLAAGPRGNQVLEIGAPVRPGEVLPDLAQSWAWAHAQLAAEVEPGTDSAHGRSRLLAARRLAPNTAYIACVVPAFAAGVAAGLEGRVAAVDGPAWRGDEATVRLPVYHAWRFSTGEAGDFAALAKRLRPQELDASVGHREIDVSDPGWGMPRQAGGTVELGGALVSPAWQPPAAPEAARIVGEAIAAQLDAAAEPPADAPAVYAPPYYGAAATRAGRVATAPPWQQALVTDVRQRAAAGLGARVVRANMDAFVDAAWQAAGDAERINQLVHRAELAAAVTQRLAAKHLAPVASDGELVAIARPLLRRLRGAGAEVTAAVALRASVVPSAVLSPSFRRMQRAGTPIRRAAGAMLDQIDRGRMRPVPLKELARRAASFDAISVATEAPARLASATPDAIAAAAVHWKVATREVRDREPTVRLASSRHGSLPPLASDHVLAEAQIDELAAASRAHQRYIAERLSKVSDAPARPLDLAAVRAELVAQLAPERGILPILASRVRGSAITSSFTPVRVRPVLARPLVEALQAHSPELVMPGIAALANNRMAIAAVDHAFVRAFLVGANEELARELLWRRYPAELGHTWLRTFWGRVEIASDGSAQDVLDIPPIAEWPPDGPAAPAAQLVLLVRGDVLRRYPNALIYAAEAAWQGGHRVVGQGVPRFPVVTSRLGDDVGLFGFELALADARGSDAPPGKPGWYFVLAEHPHEPHFGFGAAPSASGAQAWRELAWSEVAEDVAGVHVRVDGPLATRTFVREPGLRWGRDAAQLASITLRRATRVAMHASTLL